MRSGELDRRIAIQTLTTMTNSEGANIKTYATANTVWAEKRHLGLAETFTGQQEFATANLVFRVRNISGITPESRIVYDGENYDILGKNEISRSEGWEIFVKWRDNG